LDDIILRLQNFRDKIKKSQNKHHIIVKRVVAKQPTESQSLPGAGDPPKQIGRFTVSRIHNTQSKGGSRRTKKRN